MPVYLIGLPGSGKTTLGKQLASILEIPFFDLDAEIERQTGKSIPTLFEEEGEDYFREQERSCLQAFLHRKDFILATGGGTPCFFDNLDQMLEFGIVVFLNTSMDEILSRLDPEEMKTRPLFSNSESIAEKLQSFLDERIGYYQRAQITWSGSDVAELAAIIRS
jgi:shikimate kinase